MFLFFFSSRRRHTRCSRDWSSDVCSSDLVHRQRSESSAIHPVVPADRRISAAHRKPANVPDSSLHSRRKELSDDRFWLHRWKTSLGNDVGVAKESAWKARLFDEGHSPRHREMSGPAVRLSRTQPPAET